jgi:hypothetical protein
MSAMAAQGLYRDIYELQTKSEVSLSTPDYIDGYTGEVIIDAEDPSEFIDKLIMQNNKISFVEIFKKLIQWAEDDGFTGVAPILPVSQGMKDNMRIAQAMRDELGYDDATIEQFCATQTSFDADSDDIVLPDDDTNTHTPPTLEEKELVIDRALFFSSRDAVWSFNRSRAKVFRHMQLDGIKKRDWHTSFRARIQSKQSWKALIEMVDNISEQDVTTAAAVYLSIAGDYGLMPEDVAHIRGKHLNTDTRISMLDYAEEWEYSLNDILQDSIYNNNPTSESQLDKYDILKDSIIEDEFGNKVLHRDADLRSTCPVMDENPIKTAAWNIGFARSAAAGGTWRDAENAGWAQWRKEMDPKAAKEYNKVLNDTGSRTKAMQKFWDVCNPKVPRPRCVIAGILPDKSGLRICPANKTLEQTRPDQLRPITWSVVKIKLQKNELKVDEEIKARLLTKLKELNIGQAVWSLLDGTATIPAKTMSVPVQAAIRETVKEELYF